MLLGPEVPGKRCRRQIKLKGPARNKLQLAPTGGNKYRETCHATAAVKSEIERNRPTKQEVNRWRASARAHGLSAGLPGGDLEAERDKSHRETEGGKMLLEVGVGGRRWQKAMWRKKMEGKGRQEEME